MRTALVGPVFAGLQTTIAATIQASIIAARVGAQGKAPFPPTVIYGNENENQPLGVQLPPSNHWLTLLKTYQKN